MNKDWLFTSDEYICDLRAAGILIKNNKIAVQRDKNGSEYAIPGGHVKIGETTEEALVREYKEETGADVKCERLLWTEECFWEWNGKRAHNICFYYLINLCEGAVIPDKDEFLPHKDNSNVVLGWMPVEEIQKVTIYPEFLKEEIYHLNEPMKHFISRG